MKKIKTLFTGIILPSVLLLITSCNNQQPAYTIRGEIKDPNMSIDSVFVYDEEDILTSAPVKDNKFELKGHTEEPRKVFVGNYKKHFGAEVILENTSYSYILTDVSVIVTGGQIHNTVLGYVNDEAYRKTVEDYNTTSAKIMSILDKNAEGYEQAEEAADNTLIKIALEQQQYKDTYLARIVEGDYPVLTKFFALAELEDQKAYPLQKRFQLLDEYEKEIGKSSAIAAYRDILNTESTIMANKELLVAGTPFVNIIAQTPQKETVSLADVVKANKYTLLEFWASWCGHCRHEFSSLKNMYEKYKNKGFEIYAVSIDEKENDWLQALDEEKTPWINVLNAEGIKGKTVETYAVNNVPSSFLIDRKGNIVASMDEARGKQLEKTLQNLFK